MIDDRAGPVVRRIGRNANFFPLCLPVPAPLGEPKVCLFGILLVTVISSCQDMNVLLYVFCQVLVDNTGCDVIQIPF